MPADPAGRSRCLEFFFLVASEHAAASIYVPRRPEHRKATCGEAPAALTAKRGYFTAQMPSVDRFLEGGRPFVVGDRLSAADIMLATCLDWAKRERLEMRPRAVDYVLTMRRRSAFQAALTNNKVRDDAGPFARSRLSCPDI